MRHSQPHTCPHCGKMCEATTGVSVAHDTAPETGDVSVCYGCGKPGIFEVGALAVAVRPPTVAELREIQADIYVTATQAAWADHVPGRPGTVRARPSDLRRIARTRIKP